MGASYDLVIRNGTIADGRIAAPGASLSGSGTGVVTYCDGVHTGELPGRLVRGPQPAPA